MPNVKDKSCERSEPRLVLVVGRARRTAAGPLIEANMFFGVAPRASAAGSADGVRARSAGGCPLDRVCFCRSFLKNARFSAEQAPQDSIP